MKRAPLLLSSFLLAASLASGLALRHDVEEAAFLELGESFEAVVQVGGLATGTLVAPRWVLTVAHGPEMLARMRPDTPLTVSIAGKDVAVERVVVPEERAHDPKLHDIALLKLTEAVASIEPVSISVDEVRVDTEVVLVGWGILAVGDQGIEMSPEVMSSPTRARRAGRNLVDRVDEERGLLLARFDAPSEAPESPGRAVDLEVSPCVGDSGGPALVPIEMDPVEVEAGEAPRWKIVGVIAHTDDTDEDGVIGEYGDEFGMTFVALYAEWILETIEGCESEQNSRARAHPRQRMGQETRIRASAEYAPAISAHALSRMSLFALALAAAAHPDPFQENVQLTPRAFEVRSGGAYAGEVGELRVPENRADPESRTIRLVFARLTSTAEDPGPPLFLLPGGPGNAATPLARSPIWAPYLELGDVVLLDPRGVGRSEPDLTWSSEGIEPALFFADRGTAVEHMADVCAAAADDLGARGVDLAGYTTLEMIADVIALCDALEYERVHVLGHSFGTHLGLGLLALHPERVARFVSVGTASTAEVMKLPSDVDASLRVLAEVVAADPSIGEDMPDLFGVFAEAVAGLAEEPLAVPTAGGEVLLGPFGFQLLVLADLGDTADLPALPRLVHSVRLRDPSVVRWFLEKRLRAFSELPALMLTVRASSGATEERWGRIVEEAAASPFGRARCLFSPEADRALGARDVGDAFRAPVTSDVPTLFVSGTLDANTPPEQAERVRAGFTHAGHLVVEFGGHEDLIPDPEVQRRIVAFLAGAEPTDEVLARPPLLFAPLEGATTGFDHPALAGSR